MTDLDKDFSIRFCLLWASVNVLAWHFDAWGWLFLLGTFAPSGFVMGAMHELRAKHLRARWKKEGRTLTDD